MKRSGRKGVFTPMHQFHSILRAALFGGLCVACGGPQQPPSNTTGGGDQPTGPGDTRAEIERRRDAACETLGPRITSCAVEDAKAQLAAGTITQKQYNDTTASGVLAKNTQEFVQQCTGTSFSSRQVRVLEVCQREESECEPLLACLDNLNKQ
jgi:hypothetical protein